MTIKDIYKIWAPTGAEWTGWVRPVPFVALNECYNVYNHQEDIITGIGYVSDVCSDTAVIVDLPGIESVREGMALAKNGFRPIPIFNGTMPQSGSRATVDNSSAAVGLALYANDLSKCELKEDAPPAFLTDTNRLQRYKMSVSLFDNSWDVYPQDLPTPEYLLSKGITKVIVVGRFFSKDLKKILYTYQKKKIKIYFTDRYKEPKKVTVLPPIFKGKD